ncbi:GNAT family N-acetyltransferase [Virgibacillus kimchii]
MQIRQIEEKDNKTMEQIIKRSLESFGLDIPGTAYFDPQLGSLAQYYREQPNANYWVVVNEQNEVAGGVGIAPFGEEPGVCELQKLYISPEYQGRGLAKELMKTALDFAQEHYTYCYLETMEKLQAANQLYVRLGFQELEKPLEGSEHSTMDTWFIKKIL